MRRWKTPSYAGLVGSVIGLKFGLPAWLVGAVLGVPFISALINASNQAIWQSKVAPDLQGRVFSARRLIAWFTNPISPIIGGVLADFVLEPAMRSEGLLPQSVGWLVGTGPGAGMGPDPLNVGTRSIEGWSWLIESWG